MTHRAEGWDPARTPVFVLCGGLGERLRAAEPGPKALVEVAGRPFLGYLFDQLADEGFARVHLLVGVGAEAIVEAAPRLAGKLSVSWTREETPLGTGGAIGNAREHAGEVTVVVNADSYAACNWTALGAAHLHAEPATRPPAHDNVGEGIATILAVWEENRGDYGGVDLTSAAGGPATVMAFREKGEQTPGHINAGIYLFDRAVIDEIPTGPSSLERELLPRFAREGRLYASPQRCYFRDIGTPERLAAARVEFMQRPPRRIVR